MISEEFSKRITGDISVLISEEIAEGIPARNSLCISLEKFRKTSEEVLMQF